MTWGCCRGFAVYNTPNLIHHRACFAGRSFSGGAASLCASLVFRLAILSFLTAMAIAFFIPTRTTGSFARVIAV